MTKHIEGAAAKLLNIGRELDRIGRENSGIPDEAMSILTNAQFDIHEILMNHPVHDRGDVSAKFDLLGDLTRDGDEMTMEGELADRCMLDLEQLRHGAEGERAA